MWTLPVEHATVSHLVVEESKAMSQLWREIKLRFEVHTHTITEWLAAGRHFRVDVDETTLAGDPTTWDKQSQHRECSIPKSYILPNDRHNPRVQDVTTLRHSTFVPSIF